MSVATMFKLVGVTNNANLGKKVVGESGQRKPYQRKVEDAVLSLIKLVKKTSNMDRKRVLSMSAVN